MDIQTTLGLVAASLSAGFPQLVLQMALTLALLGVGVFLYKRITHYDERTLIEQGNVAAGIMLGGTTTAIAIPLAAMLASHRDWLDVILWGTVVLAFQLLFFVTIYFARAVGPRIVAGNVAAALSTVGTQLAFALLNAAAVAG